MRVLSYDIMYHMYCMYVLKLFLTHRAHKSTARTTAWRGREGGRERERGGEIKVPCHGIITVTGDLMDRFVRRPSIHPYTHTSIHPSILSTMEEEEMSGGKKKKDGKHGDHNPFFPILFNPLFILFSIPPFFPHSIPFPYSRL